MLAFDDAKQRVLDQTRAVTETEHRSVADALGRVVAEPIRAALAVPGFDNSAMDGYGVRHQDLSAEAPTPLQVVADLPAGQCLETPLAAGEAVRIMTGAPIPDGCDCVVMQEMVERQESRITIPAGQRPHQHIRNAGEDIAVGETVIEAGCRLTPPDLGILSSQGITDVTLFRRPRVGLLSSGDEVVQPGTPLKPGRIYDSNRMALGAALRSLGVEPVDLGHVPDDLPMIERTLRKAGDTCDAILSTGGVSVGDHDLVKKALQRFGSINFWKVAMKPGKPQAYGRLGKALFFGLPGNPVSGLAVFLLIVRPALLKMMGATPEPTPTLTATLTTPLHKRPGRVSFLRAVVTNEGGEIVARSTGAQGSGILTSFHQANGLIVFPADAVSVNPGEQVTVIPITW
ncbi:MAG: molybdopterin molybdotransferase MoeA [Magnetococcales bacterium]|nr:molybdopterin molybdotransferase MoeA [Magnetococcales bacterium]